MVALVVTIVILLILTGVSLNLVFGEQGLIRKANEARANYTNASIEEQEMLDRLYAEMAGYLRESTSTDPEDDSGIQIEFYIEGTPIAPVLPTGFSRITDITSEYVITDGTNEFVWVPVDKNQMLHLNITADENITAIYIYGPDTTDFMSNPGVGNIIYYNVDFSSQQNKKIFTANDICPSYNGLYMVIVETENGGQEIKTLNVTSLLTQNILNSAQVSDYLAENHSGKSFEAATHEIVTEHGGSLHQAAKQLLDYMRYPFTGIDYADYIDDYNNQDIMDYYMSVYDNGGFYIGRYEAGIDFEVSENPRISGNSSSTVEQIIATSGVPVCGQEYGSPAMYTYNYVSQPQAKALAESMYSGQDFYCSLPIGAAWDRVLGWIEETEARTSSQIYKNSSTWGNYSDNANSDGTLQIPGIQATWSAKSIYDLAGNVAEWTLEGYSENANYAVHRGGSYDMPGIDNAHERGGGDNSVTEDYIGFRPAIYLPLSEE